MADQEDREKKPNETGMHRSSGKPTLAKFIHWPMVMAAGRIWEQNNRPTPEYPDGKYPDKDGKPNYMGGISWMEIADSMLRHLSKWMMGEPCDAESGEHPLDHVFCCLNILRWQVDNRPDLDDRPLKDLLDMSRMTTQLEVGESLPPEFFGPFKINTELNPADRWGCHDDPGHGTGRMSIEDRLLKYYRWRMAGEVDIEYHDTGVSSDVKPTGTMPDWFLRMCDVGRALRKLRPYQERAVEERHRLALALEDALRVQMVKSMRPGTGRGYRGSVGEEEEIDAIRKTLRRIERSLAYRDGMSELIRGGLS
jgi:hypothetical protein